MSTPTSGPQYTLVFYVPHSSLQACKEVIFTAGAGAYPGGKYTNACFQSPGKGQFIPNAGAIPHIGTVGRAEEVEELRVETLCIGRGVVEKSVAELKKAHPYEEVAYQVYRLEDI